MVSPAFIPFAMKHNMKMKKGVCFGDLYGYATTLSDGYNTKQMVITSYLNDFDKDGFIKELRDEIGIQTNYSIKDYYITNNKIVFVFNDKYGLMKIFYKFVDVIIKALDKYNVNKSNICPFCGEEITDNGEWWLIDGSAYYLHKECANTEFEKRNIDTKSNLAIAGGSYLSGFIGAMLGSTIGGMICAIISGGSQIISTGMGIIIGGLSYIGYKNFNGKRGKGLLPIIIIAVVFGSLVSSYGSLLIIILINYFKGLYGQVSLSDIPLIYNYIYSKRDVNIAVKGDFAMTLFFALIGMIGIFISIKKDAISTNMKKL